MKKNALLAALLGIAGLSQAQPVIQTGQFNYLSATGFVYKYQTGQTAISPGAAGANVQWDFSNLAGSSTLNYSTLACPGDNDCGTFPNANQVVKLSNTAKVFYKKTATELQQEGELASGTFTFSDPLKMLQFPVTFNQNFTDSYAGTNASGSRSGTVTSTIDGYGTLKTPTGTYTNVLRQKIVENATVAASGQTLQLTITHYYWMTPDLHHYILSIQSTATQGLPVPVPTTYVTTYTTKSQTVGINDKDALAESIKMYPNPADDYLDIQTGHLAVSNITIYNMLGQKMQSRDFAGKNTPAQITLNNLQLIPGHYWIRLHTDKGPVTKQIVIN